MGVLTDDLKDRIRAYLPRYPSKQAVTLPALHLVHDELRHVPTEAVVEIAELLELHPAEVLDAMTFYEFFKEAEAEKLGKDRVWVCRGLACMLRGAYELIDHCEAKLGVKCGHTTADGRVTLEFAECIGACDGAPAVLLNDEHVMDVTPEKADRLFDDLRKSSKG
jgi:NADH-quinone oxidoreductase subunit E